MLMMTVVLCIAAVTSCKKKPEPKPEPEINISGAAKIELSGGATDGTVTFTSSEDWTATAGEGWVHVSQTSGSGSDAEVELTITCDPNPGEEPRTTTVTIKSGDVTKTITITQPGKGKEPEPEPDPIPVTGVRFEQAEYTLTVGSTLQIVPIIEPEDATNKSVTWKAYGSSLEISEDGVIKALASEGFTTLEVTTVDGEFTAECKIIFSGDIEGSHQGVVTDIHYGVSGDGGDDVSGGSGGAIGDEDSNKNGYQYKFAENTVYVTEDILDKMQYVSSGSFALPADANGCSTISNGDVFVFPPSEQFPGGYAAKVVGITADGNNFSYRTESATIEEVFRTLHIEQSGLEFGDHIEKVLGEDGREIDFIRTKAGFSLSIPEIFGGLNGLSIGLGDNVQVSPSAEVNFNMDLDADVVDCSLRYAKAKVNASARLSADVAIKKGAEKEWKSERLKVIVGAIPVGPIIITPEIYVSFTLKLSGEVNLTFSVNYQKAYYAYTYYDGAGGVHSKAGEAEIPDKKDPFAVTGNISGGIEFGPNIGFSLSVYGGALGISVDFDPHLAFTFTGSLPFTMETLANLGRTANWLANAYTEPSCSFSFGGSVDLAYAWHKEFDLPENIGLSYSFGKTYLMPKLGENLDIKVSGNMAMVSTTIKNKAWFDDNMYVLVHKDGRPNGEVFAKCPFEIPVKPAAEDDEVNCTAYVRGLVPGMRYYVEGPFMTIGALGYTADLEMTPAQVKADRVIEAFDPRILAAVKGIIKDIYAGRDGKWEDCNWDKDFDNLRNYDNVYLNYGEDGSLHVSIQLEEGWKTKQISVADHSEGIENMLGWTLSVKHSGSGPALVNVLEIDDKCFRDYNPAYLVATERLALHTPHIDSWFTWNLPDYAPDLDLSGTLISGIAIQSNVGSVVLDNCPKLETVQFQGEFYEYVGDSHNTIDPETFDIASVSVGPFPKSISVTNCPAFEQVVFGRCRMDGFYEAMGSSFVPKVRIQSCVAYELKVPDCCEEISLTNQFNIFPKLTISGCSRLKKISDWWNPWLIMRELTIEDCPQMTIERVFSTYGFKASEKIKISNCGVQELDVESTDAGTVIQLDNMKALTRVNVRCASTADITMTNLPALEYANIQGEYVEGVLPEAIQQMRKRGIRASYPHKYYYIYGWDYNYNPSRYYWKSTETRDHGFWFPGEPGQHYHFDPDDPNY